MILDNKAKTITTFYEFCLYSAINRNKFPSSYVDESLENYFLSFNKREIRDLENFNFKKFITPSKAGKYNYFPLYKESLMENWARVQNHKKINAVVAWRNDYSRNPIFGILYRKNNGFLIQPYYFSDEFSLLKKNDFIDEPVDFCINEVFKTKADCIRYNKAKKWM